MTVKRAWWMCFILAGFAALMVWTLEPYTSQMQLTPKESSSWYLWQNPNPEFWARATAWGGYILHQVFIWGAIYWAYKNKAKLSDWNVMHPINYIILGGTAFFVFLHYLQTRFFFDGLAIDVPVWSALGSVVFMLVIVILMETPRRGLIFGKGKGLFRGIQPFLYRTHGFYIAWALVYTFWYHPMYPTWGHITGFFYMYLLFMQLGFIYTKMHVNRYWTFVLEATVVVHAVFMSLINVPDMWAMFGFGFLMMILFTQMYGLGFSKAARALVAALILCGVALTYYFLGWERLNEVIRIPFILIVGAMVFGGLLAFIFRGKKPETSRAS